MNGDLLELLEFLAKAVMGAIGWLAEVDQQFSLGRRGPQLKSPRRLILTIFWAGGAFALMSAGPLQDAVVAGGVGFGVSLLLLIVWDDAPKIVGLLMWSGAVLGVVAILSLGARAAAQLIVK